MKKYYEYKDLTPISNAENVEEYLKALKWALEQDKIKNIALAGPYGAGKSSIIDTFLDRYNIELKLEKKVLKISMATFIEANAKIKSNNANDNFEKAGSKDSVNTKIAIDSNEVEIGILKQLFYTVDPEKIPQSRYRKLHQREFWKFFSKTIWYFFCILILTFIFFYEKVPGIFSGISTILSSLGITIWSYLVVLGLTFMGVYCFSRLAFDFTNKFSIKEIKLSSNVDIHKDDNSSESIFNKNLDEIVYFFEATKFRYVFFEDLDRLDDRIIFVHLRELNNILNNNESIKEKIVFVYAVKDDIFTKEDRTKFFDFIIPVIPVINSTNSGEVLLQYLQEAKANNIAHNVSQEFVLDVAPYIADMRILRNIYNEFVIYKKILSNAQGMELKDEQMLAMIIYKNLCPNDFAAIQNEKGLIKQAFVSKARYIREEKERLQNRINDITNSIISYKKDVLKDIRDIKISMLSSLANYQGITTELCKKGYYRNVVFASTQILEDDFDISKLKNSSIGIIEYYSFQYGRKDDIDIRNFDDIITPYIDRINNYKKIHDLGMDELILNIEELRYSQSKINHYSLRDIIDELGVDMMEKEVKDNKVLIFLLRRGYIDEKYANYINYFKGNSITIDDMNFILSIKNREAKSFDYELTKTAMVVERLQNYEFERKEVYNFSLLEQLLVDGNNKEKLNIFLKQLSDETNLSWQFIDEFIERTNHPNEFIKGLAEVWDRMWLYISSSGSIGYDRQLYYLELLLSNIDHKNIANYNVDNSLKEYFESHPDIIQKLQGNLGNDTIISALLALNPCFKELNIEGVENKKILGTIIDNNMYDINVPMLKNIIIFKNPSLLNEFEASPYTIITRLNYNSLGAFIDTNIETFVSNIMLIQKELKDNPNHVLEIVEKLFEKKEYDLATSVIGIETITVEKINDWLIDEVKEHKDEVQTIWNTLLKCNKVVPVWNNIVSYWNTFGFSEDLKDFIGRNLLSLESQTTDCCDDNFIKSLIKCGFDTKIYTTLLPLLRMNDFNLRMGEVSQEVLSVMINCRYFEYSTAKLDEIRKIDESLSFEYFVLNQEESIKSIEDIHMDSDLLIKLLFDNRIIHENKNKLFNVFGVDFMSVELAERMNALELNVTRDHFEVAWECLKDGDRKALLFANLNLFTANDIQEYLPQLGEEYSAFANRQSAHIVQIEYTVDNLKLADQLKRVGYITSANPGEDKGRQGKIHKVIKCRIKRIE